MNEVLKCLKERRSVRKYRSEQIKDSELEQILEAGTYAPTGMGMQSPIMVAVQDLGDDREAVENERGSNGRDIGSILRSTDGDRCSG